MLTALEIAAARAAALRAASLEADRLQAASRPGDPVFLEGAPAGDGEPYTVRGMRAEQVPSPVSGATVARYTADRQDTPARLVRTLEPRVAPPAPARLPGSP